MTLSFSYLFFPTLIFVLFKLFSTEGGQVIILIGSSASAVDICRDLAGVAKEVHLVSRSVADETYERLPGFDNMWLHSMVKSTFL